MFWYGWLIVIMSGYMYKYSNKYAWIERLFKFEYWVNEPFECSNSKPVPVFFRNSLPPTHYYNFWYKLICSMYWCLNLSSSLANLLGFRIHEVWWSKCMRSDDLIILQLLSNAFTCQTFNKITKLRPIGAFKVIGCVYYNAVSLTSCTFTTIF